jgi:hypothetical protein
MWNRGLFALKPLKLSHDRKTLTVQFFWQVLSNYEIDSEVDLLTETPSSKGLDIVGDRYFLGRLESDGSTPLICSGERTVTKPGTLRDVMVPATCGGNVRCYGMAKLG